MLKKILTLLETVLRLARDTEENRAEIKEIRKDLLNITLTMQRLADEIKLSSQRESSEREKLILQIEKELLKLDHRLVLSEATESTKQSSKRKGMEIK